jgi:hypothetical protein
MYAKSRRLVVGFSVRELSPRGMKPHSGNVLEVGELLRRSPPVCSNFALRVRRRQRERLAARIGTPTTA